MKGYYRVQAALLVFCFGCTIARAQTTTLQMPATYPAQNGPLGLATADFNGDGKLDLIVGNAGSSSISIFLGTGTGTFNAAGTASIPNGCAVAQLFAGDFTGDGNQDVLAICGFQTTVWVLPGLGTGQFGPAIATQLPTVTLVGWAEGTFATAAVADFNGDGALDLVIGLIAADPTSSNDYTLNVMLGNGNGSFQAPSANLLNSSTLALNVVAADLDGDGRPDLAVAAVEGADGTGTPTSALVILHGNGDGTFHTIGNYPLQASSAVLGATVVADVNRDGIPDVIVGGAAPSSFFGDCCDSQDVVESGLTVFLGTGGGTFNPGFTASETGLALVGLLAADFRGVGTPDLLEEGLTNDFNGSTLYTMSIRAGNGDGTFQNPIAVPGAANQSPWWFSLTAADWNGDGLPDVAFTSLPTLASALEAFSNNNDNNNSVVNFAIIAALYQSLPQANLVVMLNANTPQPTITSVQNPASNIPAILPNGGIAQGSIFVLYGSNMGPKTIVQPSALPLPSTAGLGGTVVTFTVNGTTVTAPLVYSLASQVAGVLPSNTPQGTGTVTVTFNGVSSLSFPVTVVQSNFGMSTVNETGGGPAVETHANGQIVSPSNAAKPGEELVLWGTGLGPISSSDAVAPTTNVSSSLSIQVWVGGVQAAVEYRGRSGEPGLDQINFTVPPGLSGCEVSIAVQTGTTLSNYATMAVGPNGQCSDANAIAPATVTSWLAMKSLSLADFRIKQSASTTAGTSVNPQALFVDFTQSQLVSQQAQLFGAISLGSCLVTISRSAGTSVKLAYAGLNAGTAVTFTPPSGSVLTLNPTKGVGDYTDSPNPTSLLPAGLYTASDGAGGAGAGPFSVNFTVEPFVTWTNQNSLANTAINRAQPLTIQWSGAAANTYVDIAGSTAYGSGEIRFECAAPAAPGQFTIPPAVLLALPPEPGGTLQVSTIGGGMIQVPGLDAGVLSTSNASSVAVSWK
jgi:uncharacterized protein (TIGR03437 family)